MRLSKNFMLSELIRTSHRRFDNNPPQIVIDRLEVLAVTLLQPVRDRWGPLWVTSGYRCPELNSAIGGSSSSAHMFGCAADFVPIVKVPTREIVEWIVEASGLPFDQVIDEYSSTSNWIHLGMPKPDRREPRRQALTMRGGEYCPFE